jgi:hypothetical protein
MRAVSFPRSSLDLHNERFAPAWLEPLWWARIRDGGMVDSLTGVWSLMLPGLAEPGLVRRLRPAGSARFAG